MTKIEKSKLKTISLDELEKMGIITFDVAYCIAHTSKEIILLKAGEYILPAFIDKYRAKGINSFNIKPLFDLKENEIWNNYWNEFISAQDKDEYEIYQARKKFVNSLKEIFFDAKLNVSLLSFMSITHQKFIGLNHSFMHQYADENYLLLKRSILVSSLALPLVVSLGYTDPIFLKDLYNTTLLLSYHLANEKFTITIKNALTLESKEHGLGFKYLSLKSPDEVNKLTNLEEVTKAISVSYELKNSQIKDLIYFYQSAMEKNLADALSIENDMPDWVGAVLFIDKLISYEDFNFSSNDAAGFLQKMITQKVDERFVKSYGFKKLRSVFDSFWQVTFIHKDKVA